MKPVEFKEFIAFLTLISSFIRAVRADKLFWQRRKKFSVFSVSRVHEHNGFTVSEKLCLNLCSRKWLKPKRNLLINLTPNELYIQYILFPTGFINPKVFCGKLHKNYCS